MDPMLDAVVARGGGVKAFGSVGRRLLQVNGNVNALRTLDLLTKDQWVEVDRTIVETVRMRLVGVQDLIDRGLVVNLANGLGVTRLEWQNASDIDDADVSMAGVTKGVKDRPEFELDGLPLPIIHKDFHLNIRPLMASRRMGMPLDTMTIELAARKVAEKAEELLFQGSSIKMGGSTIYGYTTALNRHTGSLTAAWNVASGDQIIGDILAMMGEADAAGKHGPYMLYVPAAYWVGLADDFKANSDRTVQERILAIPNILGIKTSDKLPAGNVVLVQMTRDVVDMVIGLQPTTVEWPTNGGMEENFKVMAIMVPRIRSDFDDASGIVHYTV